MATLEFGGEMAAGQQTAVQPYMFEPESDPEQEDVPEETTQPRNVRIRASDDRAGVLGFRVVHRSGQAVVYK